MESSSLASFLPFFLMLLLMLCLSTSRCWLWITVVRLQVHTELWRRIRGGFERCFCLRKEDSLQTTDRREGRHEDNRWHLCHNIVVDPNALKTDLVERCFQSSVLLSTERRRKRDADRVMESSRGRSVNLRSMLLFDDCKFCVSHTRDVLSYDQSLSSPHDLNTKEKHRRVDGERWARDTHRMKESRGEK